MKRKWELLAKIKPLVNRGCCIHTEYKVWSEYAYELVGNNTITLTIRWEWNNPKWGVNKINNNIVKRTFNNIIKETNAEKVSPPITLEIWYEDSLRLLYHHFPYGETNNSNVVLVNWQNRIIAIQWNGLKNTSLVHSNEVRNIPNYIVLNNSKKVEWEFHLEDLDIISEYLKTLFNNKKIKWN